MNLSIHSKPNLVLRMLTLLSAIVITFCSNGCLNAAENDRYVARDVPEEVILWALIMYSGDDVDRFLDWYVGFPPHEEPRVEGIANANRSTRKPAGCASGTLTPSGTHCYLPATPPTGR